MAKLFDGKGNAITIAEAVGNELILPINHNPTVRSVCHRGYNGTAPENTLPAFQLAKENGFDYVETDVSFTADNAAVLLHDSTVDRTSDGTGNIAELTLAEVRGLDFGSWKSADYAGVQIPTLDEFLLLCKNLELHPYIEIKNNAAYTQAQIEHIVDAVRSHGLKGSVTYISFTTAYLKHVANYDPSARLGLLSNYLTSTAVSNAKSLQTGSNDVFLDVAYSPSNLPDVSLCRDAGLGLEIWTVGSETWIKTMDGYITGVTSNATVAADVLKNANGTAKICTITNNLTNVTSDNSMESVWSGYGYSAVLTAGEGYSISSVSVSMSGADVTSVVYADGKIDIESVTGDLVITANADE